MDLCGVNCYESEEEERRGMGDDKLRLCSTGITLAFPVTYFCTGT